MNALEALAWLVVGGCYAMTGVVVLIVFAALLMWAHSRVHVRRWMRDRPAESLWMHSSLVYRVKVDDARVSVHGLGAGAAATIMTPSEFAAMARSGNWRMVPG